MFTHVYYLNPLYDFSCKQLLAAIILSIGYSMTAMATDFLCFSAIFLTANIMSTSIFPFAIQKTQGSLLQNERFGDYLLARSIYEFILAVRAHYFLNVNFAKIHGHLFSFRNIHIVTGNGPFKFLLGITFPFFT